MIASTPAINPFLWFDGQAKDAAEFYTSVFPDSEILSIQKISTGPAEGKHLVEFRLGDVTFGAVDGGPMYQLTPAISFVISCENQEEIDYYWDALTANGTPSQCGWLEDQFGISWQVVPSILPDLMARNPKAVTDAFLPMQKLDVAQLQKASKAS